MSDLRRLAAGVICTGFDGDRLKGELCGLFRDAPPAGLILFGRNIETLAQTRALTDTIRDELNSPIIAIDQEGGRVVRLRDSVEPMPSMLALGAADDERLAENAGQQMAFDLRRAGANVNFAPVLDLALDPMNTVIGTRSFGDDPARVTALAGAFGRGLERAGMIATYKHFPGHGSTAVDSHLDLPVIDVDEKTLRARDLAPFAELLPGARAVMTAHIVARVFDHERPATVSRGILTDLLRSELHFNGVCFTDCLQMDAIAKGIGSERAAVESLAAGADCLLISRDLDLFRRSIDAIVAAVENGSLKRERLEEAHARVKHLREGLQPALPLDADAPFPGIGREAALAAITAVRGETRADATAAIVVTFEGATTEGVQGHHSSHTSLTTYAAIDEIRLPLQPEPQQIVAALERAGNKRPIVLMRRAHIHEEQKSAIDQILSRHPDAILVSLREPYDAFEFPQAKHVLCAYDDGVASIAAISSVLFDGEPARGKLPIHGIPVARS